MIKFEIGGRVADPRDFKDAVMSAVLEQMRAHLIEQIGSIRDPETGEFPTVIVRGDRIDDLRVHIEGSDAVIALVKERLELEDDEEAMETSKSPKVFLSYTADDRELARRIAEALQGNGIETWWDQWCIAAGDSLRQKIDQGIADCTHFIVLLTPNSIGKPWVNQEMDAGLVRKLQDKCKFLPVRHDLPAARLPPLLSGMHSPEVKEVEHIEQLISDIYELSRKPPLGVPPAAVQRGGESKTGYSAAANSIARFFVEQSRHALFAEPQLDVKDLAKETGLSVEDTKDALFELSHFFRVTFDHVLVKDSLFTEFDRHWKPWAPADDALRLAADMMNDPDFPSNPKEIATRYGWDARRLNPAVVYLLERGMIQDYKAMGTAPWVMFHIVGKEQEVRRFVKSRS